MIKEAGNRGRGKLRRKKYTRGWLVHAEQQQQQHLRLLYMGDRPAAPKARRLCFSAGETKGERRRINTEWQIDGATGDVAVFTDSGSNARALFCLYYLARLFIVAPEDAEV